MSLFEKIGNLFSEKEKKQEKEKPEQQTGHEEKKKAEPPIESREELLKRVLDLIVTLFENVESCMEKEAVIWLDTDQLTFNTYDTEPYRQRILAGLLNECDVRFATVTFSMGRPAEELRCTPVGKSGKVFLQVLDRKAGKQAVSKTAVLSVFGNAGSLLKEQYLLSSDEMREKRIPAYNIGAGAFPQVPSGYRENHIAIDDNPDSPAADKNKFVSRMHAHIGFSEAIGFFLQVERDGTRLMGKRTRIFRGEQKIELDNPQVKEPLRDGDLIELGKAVVLRYVELEQ